MSLTAEIEPGEETKKDLLNAMELCKDLEQVEIVANPSLRFFMGEYLTTFLCYVLSTCLQSLSVQCCAGGLLMEA